jgi:hypothetical protein
MAAMSSNLGGLALGRPANTQPNRTESALYAAEWTWSICGQVSLFEFFVYAEQCKDCNFLRVYFTYNIWKSGKAKHLTQYTLDTSLKSTGSQYARNKLEGHLVPLLAEQVLLILDS